MKKMVKAYLILICMNILILPFGFGCAESASRITIDVMNSYITPLIGNEAIVLQYPYGKNEVDVYLAESNIIKNTATFTCQFGGLIPIPKQSDFPEFLYSATYTGPSKWVKWKENDLILIREMEPTNQIIVKPEGLVLGHSQQAQLTHSYEFIDLDGNLLLTMMSMPTNVVIEDALWEEDGWVLLLWKSTDAGYGHMYTVRRIESDGSIRWEREIDVPDLVTCDRLFSDGAGGIWLAHEKDYTRHQELIHLNSEGAVVSEHLLGAEGFVEYVYCAQVKEDDSIVFYGTSIDEPSIFHVFALTLNNEGNMIELDVRDFNYHDVPAISLQISLDGTVYACSQGWEGYPSILVPFSELEVIENPEFVYQ